MNYYDPTGNTWKDILSKYKYIKMLRTAKIYKITNIINPKVYVGQTWRSLKTRFISHTTTCTCDSNCRMPIVLAIQKYGKENFTIELLEEFPENTSQDIIDAAECSWGIKLNALSPSGYSLRFGKGRGICSEETKRKISIANKGKKVTAETKLKQSLAHKGVKNTPEQIKAKSERLKGKKPSKQTILASILANAKHYKLLSPTNKVTSIYNMRKFCKTKNLSVVRMCRLNKGEIKEHKGWRQLVNHAGTSV